MTFGIISKPFQNWARFVVKRAKLTKNCESCFKSSGLSWHSISMVHTKHVLAYINYLWNNTEQILSLEAIESWSCEGLFKASEQLLKACLKPLCAFEGLSEAFEMPLRACLKPLRASRLSLSYLWGPVWILFGACDSLSEASHGLLWARPEIGHTKYGKGIQKICSDCW